MKFRAFLSWVVVIGFILPVGGFAAEPSDPLSIKQYRWPYHLSEVWQNDSTNNPLRAPDFPSENASEPEVIDFIKRSNDFMHKLLKEQGAVAPDGTMAIVDPESATMAIRTTEDFHEQINRFVYRALGDVPKIISWAMEVVEAPSADVRRALEQTHLMQDHEELRLSLLKQGRSASLSHGETKPGSLSSHCAGTRIQAVAKRHTKDKAKAVEAVPIVLGQSMALDAISDRHGLIDVVLDLGQRSMPSGVVENRVPTQRLKTNFTILSGYNRMVGVLPAELFRKPGGTSLMQATFVRIEQSLLLPSESSRAHKMLRSFGEKVLPSPKQASNTAQSLAPNGMEIRRIRALPSFLEAGAVEQPVDPFAPGGQKAQKQTKFPKTAKQVMEEWGVSFPIGAWVRYDWSTLSLRACNTPENLDLIEAYLQPLCCPRNTKVLEFTIHIVQGSGATMREMQRRCLGKAEHTLMMKELIGDAFEENAVVVDTLRLDAKAGVTATVSNVMTIKSKSAAEGSTNPAGAEKDVAVGTQFEVNAVVAADGRTIDLEYQLDFDFAPPTMSTPDVGTVSANRATEFHRLSASSTITLTDGTTRLLSVWKPTGSPEFEGDVLQAAFLTAHRVTIGSE